MKCPNDQAEMERGNLVLNGTGWIRENKSLISLFFLRGIALGLKVMAWKCPKCLKIELYGEEKK